MSTTARGARTFHLPPVAELSVRWASAAAMGLTIGACVLWEAPKWFMVTSVVLVASAFGPRPTAFRLYCAGAVGAIMTSLLLCQLLAGILPWIFVGIYHVLYTGPFLLCLAVQALVAATFLYYARTGPPSVAETARRVWALILVAMVVFEGLAVVVINGEWRRLRLASTDHSPRKDDASRPIIGVVECSYRDLAIASTPQGRAVLELTPADNDARTVTCRWFTSAADGGIRTGEVSLSEVWVGRAVFRESRVVQIEDIELRIEWSYRGPDSGWLYFDEQVASIASLQKPGISNTNATDELIHHLLRNEVAVGEPGSDHERR